MKKNAIALALALTLVGSLAACSNDGTPSTGGTNNGGTNSGAPAGSGSGANGGASAGQVGRRYNTTMNQGRGSLYDGQNYFDDGRYTADANGQVYGGQRGALSRDLTQGARDIVRGTENALSDVGRGIGDAARDITGNGAYSGTPSWEPDSSAQRY